MGCFCVAGRPLSSLLLVRLRGTPAGTGSRRMTHTLKGTVSFGDQGLLSDCLRLPAECLNAKNEMAWLLNVLNSSLFVLLMSF